MGRPGPLVGRSRHLAAALALLLAACVAGGTPAASAAEHAPPAAEPGKPGVAEPGPVGGPGVAGVEEGIAAAEEGGGLPQLDASTYPSQIFWLVVAFATLYWLMTRKALPRLTEILEARQERLASDLDQAARLRAEAEAALARHQQVVAAAQAAAAAELKEVEERLTAEAARRQAALEADLARQLDEAEARIAAARDAALAEVRGVAAEVAQAAVQRLAGLKVPERDVRAALDQVLREAA